MAAGQQPGTYPGRQLQHELAVADGVHGVQAQPVHAVVLQPHQRVFDEEVAHRLTTKIDGRAPGRLPVGAEELAGIVTEVVALRTEVVVDHVHQHHQAQLVGAVHQAAQLVRRAIGRFRGERQHAVVAPVALAGEFPQGHQLHGGHAQLAQGRQAGFDLGEAAEQADVQFVDHRFMPGAAVPAGRAPGVTGRVRDDAEAVDIADLLARGGVGHPQLAVHQEAIAGARAALQLAAVPAIVFGLQGVQRAVLHLHRDLAAVRRPEGEACAFGIQQPGAVALRRRHQSWPPTSRMSPSRRR
ncbi:hypothetical protein D3C85_663910 [compost metagenome]